MALLNLTSFVNISFQEVILKIRPKVFFKFRREREKIEPAQLREYSAFHKPQNFHKISNFKKLENVDSSLP